MAVERAAVADAEGLEEDRRLEHLAQAGPGAGEAPGDVLADHRHLADDLLGLAPLAQVPRVEPEPGDAGGEAADGGGVRAAVVVEDDDGPAAGVAEVVERLVGHAAGEGAVADHGHHVVAVGVLAAATGQLFAQVLGHGQPVGVAHDGGGVAVLDPVVLGLVAARVARHAAGLAQAARSPPGAR